MGGRINYFLFNKKSDYVRGFLQNMSVDKNGICVKENTNKIGVFISRLLDSQEVEMEWHRMLIREKGDGRTSFRLSVYAGNERTFLYDNQETDLEEFIRREDISPEKKKQYLSPWLQKQTVGSRDALLHEVRGRYLWFMIETYAQPGLYMLCDIQIYFPKQTWMEYLPEIYKKEDTESFLERYLGIFQTIYEDFNEQIRAVPWHLDMDTAQDEYLTWLSGLLGIEESYIWSKGQLRYLIRNAVSLYKGRGTRQGIMHFVELYTGESPFIVEYYQQRFFQNDRRYFEKLNRLYGSDAYTFTILVKEDAIDSLRQKKTLMKIIEDVKPAHMECNLVLLKPYLFLDRHSYLGINSVLGSYTRMVLDGHRAIPFAVLEQGKGKGTHNHEKF